MLNLTKGKVTAIIFGVLQSSVFACSVVWARM